MATIVRVKRRRDADPLEVLHLAAKKQRQSAQEQQAAASSISGNLFKLAGTVNTKDSGVSQKVREAIRKEKLEKEYKRHQADILGDVHVRNREETRQSSVQNRFTLTARHRAIALDNLDEVSKDTAGGDGCNENGVTHFEVGQNKHRKDKSDADICKICGKKIRLEKDDKTEGKCTCKNDRLKNAENEENGNAKHMKDKNAKTKSSATDCNNENVSKASYNAKNDVNENVKDSACNGAKGTSTIDPRNENSVGGLCNGARSKDKTAASASKRGARHKDTVAAGSSVEGACGGSSSGARDGDVDTEKDKEGMFCLVDLEVERGPTYDSLERDSLQDQITCNGQPMAREVISENRDESDYVYDIYYTNDRNFDFRMFESDLTFEALGSRDEVWRQELVDDEFVYEDEDDDENAESNWRNDYPDEDPGFLDNQAMDYVYPDDMAHIGGFDTEETNHLADWMSWRCNLEDGAELSSDDNEPDIYDTPGSTTEAYYRRVKKELEEDSDSDKP